jgi:hypothetical protein
MSNNMGAVGHPQSSDGKMIPSLQVIHLDPSYEVADDDDVDVVEFIWARISRLFAGSEPSSQLL